MPSARPRREHTSFITFTARGHSGTNEAHQNTPRCRKVVDSAPLPHSVAKSWFRSLTSLCLFIFPPRHKGKATRRSSTASILLTRIAHHSLPCPRPQSRNPISQLESSVFSAHFVGPSSCFRLSVLQSLSCSPRSTAMSTLFAFPVPMVNTSTRSLSATFL